MIVGSLSTSRFDLPPSAHTVEEGEYEFANQFGTWFVAYLQAFVVLSWPPYHLGNLIAPPCLRIGVGCPVEPSGRNGGGIVSLFGSDFRTGEAGYLSPFANMASTSKAVRPCR